MPPAADGGTSSRAIRTRRRRGSSESTWSDSCGSADRPSVKTKSRSLKRQRETSLSREFSQERPHLRQLERREKRDWNRTPAVVSDDREQQHFRESKGRDSVGRDGGVQRGDGQDRVEAPALKHQDKRTRRAVSPQASPVQQRYAEYHPARDRHRQKAQEAIPQNGWWSRDRRKKPQADDNGKERLVPGGNVKNESASVNEKFADTKKPVDPSEEDPELKAYAEKKIQKKTVDVIGRTGGVYIPPFKLAELQKRATDKSSPEYQRQSWEALRKSINGLVNKVNVGNITNLVQDLFRENLVRGRGLIARAIIRAQMASPGFTHIYAALLSILNSKLPELGDLVLRRILLQFRRAYRRNDKLVCKACMKFLAHLVNQKMVHELLALQLTMLLLEKLTDDSVELCVEFIQEVGQVLQDISPQAFRAIIDRLRAIAQEGTVDRRVQYIIEGLQRTVATKFAEYPGVLPELDLVEEEDKITHEIDLLDPDIKGDEMLNIFKPEEPEVFLKNEAAWAELSAEILGEKEDDAASDVTSEDSENEMEETAEKATVQIHDMTEKDIIALRKTIYLTIMSSANYEECLHKILKLNIKEGQEIQVCTMLIDCNAMERTFQRFFALQAERLCRLKPIYQECFLGCLERQYAMIHHLETNKIRSTAKFFAHLLYTDALPWSCLELFVLTEAATTSASRIFIKVLFQELAEQMGLRDLHARLHDPALAPHLHGIFPTDHPKNIRFSINFFTAVGLGGLTSSLRELLTNLQNQTAEETDSSSSLSNETSSSSSDSDSSSNGSGDDRSSSCVSSSRNSRHYSRRRSTRHHSRSIEVRRRR